MAAPMARGITALRSIARERTSLRVAAISDRGRERSATGKCASLARPFYDVQDSFAVAGELGRANARDRAQLAWRPRKLGRDCQQRAIVQDDKRRNRAP